MTSPIGDEEVWKPYRRLVRFCVGLFVVVEDDKLAKFLVVGDERMGGGKGWRLFLAGFGGKFSRVLSANTMLRISVARQL